MPMSFSLRRHLAITFLCVASSIASTLCLSKSYADESTLNEQQSQRLDQTVDRALERLATLQQRDGSFPTLPSGQPGVTCLSTLAFLSAGHLPGSKPYGDHVERAVRYTLNCERMPGMFNLAKPGTAWRNDTPSHTGYYNQAIAGLMLSEISGELAGELGTDVISAVERALSFTVSKQFRDVPQRRIDEGGWRYPAVCQDGFVSDLSVTAWQVTFLRSAKNAGFDVDDDVIKAAAKYVKGLYKSREGTFTYAHQRISRGMAGAGIMSMAMLGQHNSDEALGAAKWLQKNRFSRYGQRFGQWDRFQYSLYYCSQGMYHLGGEHFREFFPPVAEMLIANQRPNGSWPGVNAGVNYGEAYVTSMTVLALTTHYAMLPIHQR